MLMLLHQYTTLEVALIIVDILPERPTDGVSQVSLSGRCPPGGHWPLASNSLLSHLVYQGVTPWP